MAAAAAIALTMTAGAASAVTFGDKKVSGAIYSEDGFTFSPYRMVKGNCADGACLALNDNETTTMSRGGDAFSLDSLGFSLLGAGNGGSNTLTVTGDNAMSLSFAVSDWGHNNGYHVIDFRNVYTGFFDNVRAIAFSSVNGGNIRIDDVVATPVAAVPLPAALPLFLAAIAGLGFIGGRRRGARAA